MTLCVLWTFGTMGLVKGPSSDIVAKNESSKYKVGFWWYLTDRSNLPGGRVKKSILANQQRFGVIMIAPLNDDDQPLFTTNGFIIQLTSNFLLRGSWFNVSVERASSKDELFLNLNRVIWQENDQIIKAKRKIGSSNDAQHDDVISCAI